MKKSLLSDIIYLLIIFCIATVSSVFAYSYMASNVGYTPADSTWSVENVQGATDSLYFNIKGRNPIGEIINFMGNNTPDYFLSCDGTVYNISDYPYLAEHFKTEFGSYNYFGGNGTTTFAVPDLRGEFLRGTGTNGHSNEGSGADVGVHQAATVNNVVNRSGGSGTMYISNQNTQYGVPANYDFVKSNSGQGRIAITGTAETYSDYALYTIRPTNTSVLYAIRYE